MIDQRWLECLSSVDCFGESVAQCAMGIKIDHKLRREYIALAGSLIFIFLEGLISVITLGLRKSPLLEHTYRC